MTSCGTSGPPYRWPLQAIPTFPTRKVLIIDLEGSRSESRRVQGAVQGRGGRGCRPAASSTRTTSSCASPPARSAAPICTCTRGARLPSPASSSATRTWGSSRRSAQGVTSIKQGDRVVMPFNVACGFCKNCVAGYTGFCLTVNPGFAGGAYGYVAMGPYQGGQAEYLRVPFADFNCLKLPAGHRARDRLHPARRHLPDRIPRLRTRPGLAPATASRCTARARSG